MTIELVLASLPDREAPVVELWLDQAVIAEVSEDDEGLRVEFYPLPDEKWLNVRLDEVLQALALAKERFG